MWALKKNFFLFMNDGGGDEKDVSVIKNKIRKHVYYVHPIANILTIERKLRRLEISNEQERSTNARMMLAKNSCL